MHGKYLFNKWSFYRHLLDFMCVFYCMIWHIRDFTFKRRNASSSFSYYRLEPSKMILQSKINAHDGNGLPFHLSRACSENCHYSWSSGKRKRTHSGETGCWNNRPGKSDSWFTHRTSPGAGTRTMVREASGSRAFLSLFPHVWVGMMPSREALLSCSHISFFKK